jgi:hypothetical protein
MSRPHKGFVNEKVLLTITILMGALSLLTYLQQGGKEDSFERGQKLLANFNVDHIHKIAVTQDGKTITLKRENDRFTMIEKSGFPAKNQAVNRLLKSVLDIALEKEIGASDELRQELDLTTEAAKMVVFESEKGQKLLELFIGKTLEGGQGNYLYRTADQAPIYLSQQNVFLNADETSLLDNEVVNVAADTLSGIQSPEFQLQSDDSGNWTLSGMSNQKVLNSSNVDRLKRALAPLRIQDALLADDASLQGLTFNRTLTYFLKDGSRYLLSLAEKGEKTYVKISGVSDIERVSISKDESEEELKAKSEKLQRADELKKFNAFQGSWVYELSDHVASTLKLSSSDLVTDAKE